MGTLPFAATTPLSIGKVGLKARDAEALAQFYREVVGLGELARENGAILLGAGETPLLVIEADPRARPDDPREAGLFHTAFLLPGRSDLARWLRFAGEKQVRLDGASDHSVSEALYLSDPEGNGIEIYADRPPETWQSDDAGVKMTTERLDVEGILASIDAEDEGWRGAPDGAVIGHVHLRVGDANEAARWWHGETGLDLRARYGSSAVFLSSGGYHHHIGANSWHSAGAGKRDPGRAGLAFVELRAKVATDGKTQEDPWGTVVRMVSAA